MSVAEIANEVAAKLENVRSALAQEITGAGDVCLTCSFQAEDVLLTKLAIAIDPAIPILFLDTGYHFTETYEYRDRIAREWNLNLVNLLPAQTVEQQEAQFGILYQSAPDQCCKLRKVEPLFKAVAEYRVWITGLRREQAKSRAALEERALFTLPGGKQVIKLAPLTEWTTRDVWHACEQLGIPRLSLYDRGYSSIGCEPCTSLPLDPNDPRSGRWAGRKVECGIHIEAGK
ncbi:phosphoadenylyl-sulfate reductase [Occallatibacter riparius]|uniref:Adenosine 5'-phosphosulfate reductase n=1 Tax=Occallatibacter riparius TaxID=1002689 RepID=A0A9J7BIZ8_9BACT|nr:phosphoadenylyl-sulfate reductase [Occallatibacter riparius]UWZ82483.1 phosphoadenylyl-sulfate reductase [Occallatibacter riparius]